MLRLPSAHRPRPALPSPSPFRALLAITASRPHLPDRRRLEVGLEQEVAVSTRPSRPLVVAMIDVDHFKAYNDALGHPAADVALQDLARLLMANVRTGDTVYRYGGEELVVVMRETDIQGAAHHAERLCRLVEHQDRKSTRLNSSH